MNACFRGVSQPRVNKVHTPAQQRLGHLAPETVEGASLPLEGVDNIHGSDGLPARVLGVGHSVTDDVLEEHLEDTAGLLVDEARDTLDTATTRQTTDGGLGDTLDVIAQHLAVTLGASFAQALASFAATRHDDMWG